MQQLKINAFTLIETLLIIAVLAVLITASIESYITHSRNFKIDKTAQEIQYLMQAASAYYNESATNGATPIWPAKNGYTDKIPADFKRYVPVDASAYQGESISNTYGFYYQISGLPEANKADFRVKTQVPDVNVANLIAKKLPYGAVLSQGEKTYVEAGVYPPGSQLIDNDPSGFTIKKIGTYTFSIPEPFILTLNCPIGQNANAIAMVTALKQHKDRAAYWLYYKVDIETQVLIDSSGLNYITFTPTYESKTQDLRIVPIPAYFTMSYMVYCEKSKAPI